MRERASPLHRRDELRCNRYDHQTPLALDTSAYDGESIPLVRNSPTGRASDMRLVVAVASFMMISLTVWGQESHRPHSTTPPAESAPTGAVNPELETMTRAVAIQARADQVGYFRSAISSTDTALQLSRELQTLGPAAQSIPTVNARSLQLRDTLDDVEHYYGRFVASFSKTQSTELKPLTKRVRKSYTFVARESKTVQQRMEPGKVVPERLANAAANLEKALSDFRTDQVRLAREMGIQSN